MKTEYLGTVTVQRRLTEEEIYERQYQAYQIACDKVYRRLMIKQKLSGLAFLIITGFIFYMAYTGTTFIDKDCTAALLTAPIGLWMLFSRKIIIVGGPKDYVDPEDYFDYE